MTTNVLRETRARLWLILGVLVGFHAGTSAGGVKTSVRLDAALQSARSGDVLLVWVYFTDKGRHEAMKVSVPPEVVTPRSLARRAKSLPVDMVVDYTDLPPDEGYVASVASHVTAFRHYSKWFNAVSIAATAEEINTIRGFSFVREIDLVYRSGRPGDPEHFARATTAPEPALKAGGDNALDYGSSLPQVALENIPAVHNTGNTAQGVLIALFDNGFRLLAHQTFDSLRARILGTYDFVDHKVSVIPNNPSYGSHGTWTLSTIAGYSPGQLIGPAFGASFLLGRTENDSSETPFEEDNWVRAIEWADSLGVDVTSTSLGYFDYDPPYPSWTWQDMDGKTTPITRAAVMAARKGILVVNSAGNEGVNRGSFPNSLNAPADADSILAVGAVNPLGVRASFSSFGPTADGRTKPEVMAVGTSIYAASADNATGFVSGLQGTSFSCPLTAGGAALVWHAHPRESAQRIIYALKRTASRSTAPDNMYGWGIIDVLRAIQFLSGDSLSTLPAEATLQQNYPNPFNPGTRIGFILPEDATVTVAVYDLLGREVRTLVHGFYPKTAAVPYQIAWDGTDASGRRLASGAYFCRLTATGASGRSSTQVRKMMILR
ncbi:MAG: S8 family serine peptidase [Bacteroidota bacterium]